MVPDRARYRVGRSDTEGVDVCTPLLQQLTPLLQEIASSICPLGCIADLMGETGFSNFTGSTDFGSPHPETGPKPVQGASQIKAADQLGELPGGQSRSVITREHETGVVLECRRFQEHR